MRKKQLNTPVSRVVDSIGKGYYQIYNYKKGGLANGRDLGGLKTVDSRIVKHGKFIRSGKADAPASAGDDGDFIFQFHGSPSLCLISELSITGWEDVLRDMITVCGGWGELGLFLHGGSLLPQRLYAS